jgi:hypothetical protein
MPSPRVSVRRTTSTCREGCPVLHRFDPRLLSERAKEPFKWRYFQGEIILLCMRWYLRYPLSYRNLQEMMLERELEVDHTTIC